MHEQGEEAELKADGSGGQGELCRVDHGLGFALNVMGSP